VPYQPPKQTNIIKLRTVYTLGQPDHPGSRKAVITLSIQDLISKGEKLLQSKKSQHKFKLLAGQRWNPQDDSLKISCDDFPTFNMNAKWCSDVLDSLIAEARVSAVTIVKLV
jgi:small subunit ribosomal protein S35